MEMILVLVAILQSMAISLGVGGSTLAIVNFFVAIADGKIDENERRMMGVVYTVLRVAMVIILVTTIIIGGYAVASVGIGSLSAFLFATWTLVAVLYTNAILMTKKIMPSTVGPALQAATWYTLGICMTLIPLSLSGFTFFQFIVGYAAAIALAVSIVNGIMAMLKKKKANV